MLNYVSVCIHFIRHVIYEAHIAYTRSICVITDHAMHDAYVRERYKVRKKVMYSRIL